MKQIAKILAALVLLSALSACDRSSPPPAESDPETTVLSDTTAEHTETTGTPETTEKPTETTTGAPETTEKPTGTTTGTPETTEKPEETTTGTPETTEKPEETTTGTPETTEKPEETTTGAPETTEKPEETTTGTPETTQKPVETTTEPEETTTEPEEELPEPIEISVSSADGNVKPQSYYIWEGDAYDAKLGAANMLFSVAHALPILSMSDDLQILLPVGGQITKLEAYNTSFLKNNRVSGNDPAVLSRLQDGLWHILVAVTVTEEGQTRGAEFLFSLYIGEPWVLIDDGDAFLYATEIRLGGTQYDAATDSMKSDMILFDPSMLAPESLPIVTCNEYLSYVLLGSMQTSALQVYTTSGAPVMTSGDSLPLLSEQLSAGSYCVVISVTWNGAYIASQSCYETQSVAYAVLLTVV